MASGSDKDLLKLRQESAQLHRQRTSQTGMEQRLFDSKKILFTLAEAYGTFANFLYGVFICHHGKGLKKLLAAPLFNEFRSQGWFPYVDFACADMGARTRRSDGADVFSDVIVEQVELLGVILLSENTFTSPFVNREITALLKRARSDPEFKVLFVHQNEFPPNVPDVADGLDRDVFDRALQEGRQNIANIKVSFKNEAESVSAIVTRAHELVQGREHFEKELRYVELCELVKDGKPVGLYREEWEAQKVGELIRLVFVSIDGAEPAKLPLSRESLYTNPATARKQALAALHHEGFIIGKTLLPNDLFRCERTPRADIRLQASPRPLPEWLQRPMTRSVVEKVAELSQTYLTIPSEDVPTIAFIGVLYPRLQNLAALSFAGTPESIVGEIVELLPIYKKIASMPASERINHLLTSPETEKALKILAAASLNARHDHFVEIGTALTQFYSSEPLNGETPASQEVRNKLFKALSDIVGIRHTAVPLPLEVTRGLGNVAFVSNNYSMTGYLLQAQELLRARFQAWNITYVFYQTLEGVSNLSRYGVVFYVTDVNDANFKTTRESLSSSLVPIFTTNPSYQQDSGSVSGFSVPLYEGVLKVPAETMAAFMFDRALKLRVRLFGGKLLDATGKRELLPHVALGLASLPSGKFSLEQIMEIVDGIRKNQDIHQKLPHFRFITWFSDAETGHPYCLGPMSISLRDSMSDALRDCSI